MAGRGYSRWACRFAGWPHFSFAPLAVCCRHDDRDRSPRRHFPDRRAPRRQDRADHRGQPRHRPCDRRSFRPGRRRPVPQRDGAGEPRRCRSAGRRRRAPGRGRRSRCRRRGGCRGPVRRRGRGVRPDRYRRQQCRRLYRQTVRRLYHPRSSTGSCGSTPMACSTSCSGPCATCNPRAKARSSTSPRPPASGKARTRRPTTPPSTRWSR